MWPSTDTQGECLGVVRKLRTFVMTRHISGLEPLDLKTDHTDQHTTELSEYLFGWYSLCVVGFCCRRNLQGDFGTETSHVDIDLAAEN